MKHIIIAILATTLFFVLILLQVASDTIQADQTKLVSGTFITQPVYISSDSHDGLMAACRGDLEGDGYTVTQNSFGYIFPGQIFTATGTIKVATTSLPNGSLL